MILADRADISPIARMVIHEGMMHHGQGVLAHGDNNSTTSTLRGIIHQVPGYYHPRPNYDPVMHTATSASSKGILDAKSGTHLMTGVVLIAVVFLGVMFFGRKRARRQQKEMGFQDVERCEIELQDREERGHYRD